MTREPERGISPRHGWRSRALLAAALVLGFVVFLAAGGERYLSLESLREHRATLRAFGEHHVAATVALAFVTFAALALFGLPGGSVVSVAIGFMLGRWPGTFVALAAATAGATLMLLAARYVIADFARRRVAGVGARLVTRMDAHPFSTVLFLRLVPLMPFVVANVVPAITTVPLRTYVTATFLGLIPSTFVFASLGDTLRTLDSAAELLSWRTLGLLGLLSLLALLPFLWQRRLGPPAQGIDTPTVKSAALPPSSTNSPQ